MKKLIFFIFFILSSAIAEIDYPAEIESLKSIGTKSFDKNEKADLIFIDFWASWCDPCKESFPFYSAKIKSQKKKKILFISVNLDDSFEKAQQFLKEYPQENLIVWDKKKKLMGLLGFDSIPYLVLLDKDWKELEKINGFNAKTKKKINNYLK